MLVRGRAKQSGVKFQARVIWYYESSEGASQSLRKIGTSKTSPRPRRVPTKEMAPSALDCKTTPSIGSQDDKISHLF